MSATSRELVYQTLDFAGPARVPRDLWPLPAAERRHAAALAELRRDYPVDLRLADPHQRVPCATRGDRYAIGEFTDEWGCTFQNLQAGIIGEVKTPLVNDWAADAGKVHIPRELLTLGRDAINRDCAATDKFVYAGWAVNPFERLQHIRGAEGLYLDLTEPPPAMQAFVRELHAFNCDWLTAFAQTDVDALMVADDWGSQRALLIAPPMWRELFKPLYRDYVQIAHAAGKKFFLHSDGYIVDIYPDLIELGVDALNSQLFCMGIERLAPFAGKITFWGEIDRQHLLPHGTTADIDHAVRAVHHALWKNGGCIAGCEFGPDARPANVRQVFASWNAVTR
jgi:uroporphyrinogen decarboxylase